MSEGRRERVKERVRKEGIENFAPHEVLEYMLYPFIPRKDTTSIAHALLTEFGTIDNVLHASEEALLTVPRMPKAAALAFPQYRKIIGKASREKILNIHSLDNTDKAAKYLIEYIGSENLERVSIVLLNSKCSIINVKIISSGDPVRSEVNVREIVNSALNSSAAGIILAHNHPSGDLRPSEDDIAATKFLKKLLDGLSIKLYDHLIVNRFSAYSLRENGLLGDAEVTTGRVGEKNGCPYI